MTRITSSPALPTPHPCRVCGCGQVHADAVADLDRGLMLLAECTRCEHRWTERRAAVVRVQPRRGLEVVPSAA
jgi:hypothetical protein